METLSLFQINNNGYLTFDWPLHSYIPYQFPGYGGRDIIAPFWTDIDNRGNGVISYRQYTSGSVLWCNFVSSVHLWQCPYRGHTGH